MTNNNSNSNNSPDVDRLEGNYSDEHLSEIYRCLASKPRRSVLRHFSESETGLVALDRLALELVEDLDEYTDEDTSTIESQLHHVHLPALENAKLVEYYPDDEIVQYIVPRDLEDLIGSVSPGQPERASK